MERIVNATPERVLSRAHEYFRTEWPHGGLVGTNPHTVQAYHERGFLPATAAGWIFNLFMTAVTLGGWLLIWALYAVFTFGNAYRMVSVSAYGRDDGTTRVLIEGSPDEWVDEVVAWMDETFVEKKGW